ncbi:MAG: endonuclease III [Christensenellaceae bacterium]|jgi:endonuclease-3|nr:endonuclease III [Christensenellaceae bacterium]
MLEEKISDIFNILSKSHPDAFCELIYSSPFELLVAIILSAQCSDKRVNLCTENLFKHYNKPTDFMSLSIDELKPYIFSCGFYNNKAKSLIEMSKSLVENFNGVIPKTLEELLTLKGVGRKTASVLLSVAFDIPAMPVDTHVFRVSRRLGLSNGKTPEKVESDLMALFSKDKWNSLHHFLIFHGRYVCHSRKPNCGECELNKYCLNEFK